MKYETPELAVSTPAISAIQSVEVSKSINTSEDGGSKSLTSAYSDWE
jgi:hypothetical protein